MGNPIRAIRKRLGLTQAEFADKLGIGREYLSAIERGQRVPSLTLRLAVRARENGLEPIGEVAAAVEQSGQGE